jgi:hypothetical protein
MVLCGGPIENLSNLALDVVPVTIKRLKDSESLADS